MTHVRYIDKTREYYKAEGYDTWKAACFTKERPFLDEEATARWLERKQAYRDVEGVTPL